MYLQLPSHVSFQKLSVKYEEEVRARDEAEQNLRSFRKDVDDATAVRLDLERRLELMMDEINFLRTVHDEEIQELSTMMEKQQVSVELELANPDLTSALKEIRNQYESIASKNLQSAEEWYKSKFASLSEQASRTNEAMRASREEVSEFRRQLQSKTIEIESLRGANESLERQITEMEVGNNAEVSALQVSNKIITVVSLKGAIQYIQANVFLIISMQAVWSLFVWFSEIARNIGGEQSFMWVLTKDYFFP